MKYVKILGLLAVAAAALMAFAGTASATLTSGGTAYNGTIHATSEGNISLTGTLNITCTHSTAHGHVEENTATTAGGKLTSLSFTNCNSGNATVTVVAPGSLTVHSLGNNTGTATSKNANVTVLVHNIFLGTIHCTYITPSTGTDIGTVTGSGHSGNTTATLDISASIQRDPNTSDFGCGEHATWEGSYKVETPDNLTID